MTTDNAGTHSHSTTALDAEIAALKARVTALETPAPPPVEPPPPTTGKVVKVTSVAALLATLSDDTVDEIVVANGTYRIPGASTSAGQTGSGLWINERFADRTRPVVIRAETTGGVTFDGGGATYWIGLAFLGGAHDQTWQGFRFANAEPTQAGVVSFGWGGSWSTVAPHHITLRDITIAGSITSDNPPGVAGDHGVYFSQSIGGVHDVLIDGLTVDGSGGLDSALHFYHSTATEPNARNVTVRNMAVTGTDQAVILWDGSLRDILIEDSTITGAPVAVRYEVGGTVTLRRVASSGSKRGFYSSLGSNPPGITLIDCDLR